MTSSILCALLLVAAGPVPPGLKAPPASPNLNSTQVNQFASLVDSLIQRVHETYVKKTVTEKDLLAGAIRGLYDEVGLPVPDKVTAAIAKANLQVARTEVLREARMLLGDHPKLAGTRAVFAAINGFRFATDPNCGLYSPRISTYVSIDQDFGVGIELEGVVGTPWSIYQAEHGVAAGRYVPYAYFGSPPKPDAIPSPANFPWRLKQVVPGSPAQEAGLKPGDVITQLNGIEITAANANRMFASLAYPRQTFDSKTGNPLPLDRTFTIRRSAEKPFFVTIKNGVFNPESAFGVIRNGNKWDCMLDRDYKIGYIRLGAVETGLDDRVEEMMVELDKRGCRGLILDLRWCPGGYVTPGTNIAGIFLEEGKVIAKMEFPNQNAGRSGDELARFNLPKFTRLPIVVLIGPDTIGGGELIASALRDNNRCVLLGQRTFGRATIQNVIETGYCGMQFRITTGASLRPNGKNRQRMPDSQPTDEWGLRPDEGLEVPVTTDKLEELREQADLHALRPADSREALPFDDPALDPHRLAALVYLRKKLGPPKK